MKKRSEPFIDQLSWLAEYLQLVSQYLAGAQLVHQYLTGAQPDALMQLLQRLGLCLSLASLDLSLGRAVSREPPEDNGLTSPLLPRVFVLLWLLWI